MPRYPFNPELLDALPEELSELFRGLEITLLEEICSRLKIADNLNEVTVQDIRALRSHGISLKAIEDAIRETTGMSWDKLNKLLDDVVERNQVYYTDLINLAKVTMQETLVDAAVIDAIRRQTIDEFRNITQSMGFLVNGGRTMLPPARAYQWALDSALLQVESGAFSYNNAIKMATRQLADSGLKTVQYESGHVDHVDVAVRRAVMTGITQINAQYTEQSAEYLETPYFEVSAHIGARDVNGPSPWSSHKAWQGKVYSIRSGDIYPNIFSVCGLGYVDGLEGANCRHNRSPWIEGVSERTYTDEELANIDPPPFEFEGKKYTMYQATQKQRQIERTIRKWKRREAAAMDDEEKTVCGVRIRRLNQEYKAFSKAAGLPEQRDRMAVYQPRTVENSANRGILNDIGLQRVQITDESIGRVPLIQPEGWTEERAKKLQEANRELLRYVKDKPVGTEVAFVLNESAEIISDPIDGELDKVTVPEFNVPHIVIHNHPDCLIFSGADLIKFVMRSDAIGIEAIGNDGTTVYAMFKKSDFDGMLVYDCIADKQDSLSKARESGMIDDYVNIIDDILREVQKYGVEVITRKNSEVS